MYIEKIKIGNFGKLHDKEYDLSRGVNIIEGKNESGKTTIGEFIKFIFYGLSNKIDYNTDLSERKRHISWKSNDAAGSIVINTGEKRYRIERSLFPHGVTYRDEFTVVDLASNSEVMGINNPGEFFFGIPEDVFTHTVYIRQADGAYFNGESIGQAVENIFYSADESVNTEKALKKLDDARMLLKHKKNTGRGLLDRLEKEKEELSLRLEKAREDNIVLLKKEEALRDNKNAALKNKADIQTYSDIIRKKELHSIIEKFDSIKA
ncbi:MAG: AAA family ATPase, partial [Clostridia bacterium]|nr:AAA family ATPase [Clostridia bacterium]